MVNTTKQYLGLDKNLLYSPENSTLDSLQYSVMTCMGKESFKKKRMDICVCITDSLSYTSETNRIL